MTKSAERENLFYTFIKLGSPVAKGRKGLEHVQHFNLVTFVAVVTRIKFYLLPLAARLGEPSGHN